MGRRRWGLTDFQKIMVYLGVMAAVFLAAMALGRWSPLLLAAGVGLLVVVVLGVYGIQLRRQTAGSELATAEVLAVSAVPANVGVVASCTMRLAIFLFARGRVERKVRVTALSLDRWPTRGQRLPVEILGGNPRRMRIRWDLVDAGLVRAPDQSASVTGSGPSQSEPHRPPTYTSATYTSAYAAEPPPPPAPPLFEHFTDFDDFGDETQRTPEPPDDGERGGGDRRLPLPLPRDPDDRPSDYPDVKTNGHDPDGVDLADFEEPSLQPTMFGDFDPADIDRSDFLDLGGDDTPEGPTVTGPTMPSPTMPSPTVPSPRDPAAPVHGVEISLGVADLSRSLRFYRDALGLRVAYTTRDSVVVESGGIRIALESRGPAAGVAETVHLEVTDIQATCATLRARGIEIVVPPTATGGGTAQLWRAWLRDPDGHDVELVEWRQRS